MQDEWELKTGRSGGISQMMRGEEEKEEINVECLIEKKNRYKILQH